MGEHNGNYVFLVKSRVLLFSHIISRTQKRVEIGFHEKRGQRIYSLPKAGSGYTARHATHACPSPYIPCLDRQIASRVDLFTLQQSLKFRPSLKGTFKFEKIFIVHDHTVYLENKSVCVNFLMYCPEIPPFRYV